MVPNSSLWGHRAPGTWMCRGVSAPHRASGRGHRTAELGVSSPELLSLEKGLAKLLHVTPFPPGVQPASAHTQEALELRSVG